MAGGSESKTLFVDPSCWLSVSLLPHSLDSYQCNVLHTHTILLQNVFSLHTFIVQDFDCKSQFFCRFHQIWFFYFSVLWVYGFDFFSLSLSLSHPFYKFMSEHLILARFFLFFFCNIHFYYKLSSIHISACLDRRQQQDKQHRNHSHVYQRLKKKIGEIHEAYRARLKVNVYEASLYDFYSFEMKSLTCYSIGFI